MDGQLDGCGDSAVRGMRASREAQLLALLSSAVRGARFSGPWTGPPIKIAHCLTGSLITPEGAAPEGAPNALDAVPAVAAAAHPLAR